LSYISEEELKSFLGKQLNDEYGRTLGRVVGLRISDYGQLEALEVEKGNGNLAQYPIELVTLDRGSLFLVSDWKVTCETVSKELDRIRRRIRALGELLQEHQIPPTIYEEIKRKQEQSLTELDARRKDIINNLETKKGGLDKQVDELIRFLVNVKMEYRAGLIDESALTVACDAIEPNMKPILQEKKDVSKAIETMSSDTSRARIEMTIPPTQVSTQVSMQPTEQPEDLTQENHEPEPYVPPQNRSGTGPIPIQIEG
jgi:chromosome segregation ATPase